MKKSLPIVIVVLSILAAQCAMADVKIVNTAVVIMNGKEQKESSGDMTAYCTEDKMRTEDVRGMVTIIRLDKGCIWALDTASKTYTEQTFEQLKKQMEAMPAGAMNVDIDIEKTDEEKKIGKYNCTKFIVKTKMMGTPIEQELWATGDIEIDPALMKFYEKMEEIIKDIPMLKNAFGSSKEIFENKVFPVQTTTETSMFGMTTKNITTLKSISSEDLEESLFEIPEDYKQKKMRTFGGR